MTTVELFPADIHNRKTIPQGLAAGRRPVNYPSRRARAISRAQRRNALFAISPARRRMRSGRSSTGCWTINSPISARHRLTWRSFLMEKRTAIKIINAAGLMSLVLFAVCWQPGVTAATKGPRTERVADANGNLRVPNRARRQVEPRASRVG